jgi:hypothetical protein
VVNGEIKVRDKLGKLISYKEPSSVATALLMPAPHIGEVITGVGAISATRDFSSRTCDISCSAQSSHCLSNTHCEQPAAIQSAKKRLVGE